MAARQERLPHRLLPLRWGMEGWLDLVLVFVHHSACHHRARAEAEAREKRTSWGRRLQTEVKWSMEPLPVWQVEQQAQSSERNCRVQSWLYEPYSTTKDDSE